MRADLVAAALHQLAEAFAAPPLEQAQAVSSDRLLTYAQVAELLGVDESTARRRGRAGAWPEVRDGGLVRVRLASLERFIKSRESSPRFRRSA